ncbi:MAG: ATP-binding protein [Paludibacteraceae bacterium]|nr:ATP-binding protein [Paludibacteraceae bacterium]
MSRIKIKNFGPIREGFLENDGWIDVKKVTVLIGDQGTGKSTVAKLISIFSWIEKDLFRSNGSTLRYRKQERNFNPLLEYHRINDYLKDDTVILYEGDAYKIGYQSGQNLDIQKINSNAYSLPKITYYPAERNFVSSVRQTKNSNKQSFKLWSESLQEFKEIFQESKEKFRERETLNLPIGNAVLEYNKLNDILYVKGVDYKIQLADSASGFQSFVPLFVVANYVSELPEKGKEMDEQQRETFKKESVEILNDKTYTEEQKRILLSNLAAQFNVKRTLNIVEEPEQNLFPNSQQKVINSLIEYNNAIKENKLIISTHSPYILSSLNNSILAEEVFEKTEKSIDAYGKDKRVAFADVSAYQLDNGRIYDIKDYETNLINAEAIDSCSDVINSDFDQLLDLMTDNEA